MANRETQVPITAIVVGSPHARVTQVPVTAVMGGNPDGRVTQVYRIAIVPHGPNSTPPGGTLQYIQEFLLP